MSVTAPTAQWWIRTDGADTNGGGYDSAIGGGSNLCDAASGTAVSWTSLTLAAGTLTDAGTTGLFTTSMIGNAVNVPGQGYYWITARTNGNVVTVTPGTGATTSFTTQPGKVGGALRNPSAFSNGVGGSINPGTATAVVPGNQINIRASGSGSVGSPDYSQTGFAHFPNGDAATDGKITWVAYNGTPYYVANGIITGGAAISYHRWYGIYFACNGTSSLAGNNGLLPTITGMTFIGCTFDGNNQAGASVCGASSGSLFFLNCTMVGGGTSSSHGLYLYQFGTAVKNCKISGWGGYGIYESDASCYSQISNCAIYGNTGGGIRLITNNSIECSVDGCTIDSNGGDGININTTLSATWTRILNNNITTNGGYGINVAAGTAAANTAAIAYEDYNNFGSGATLNVSGAYHNLNGGAHDINVDPVYI